MTISLGSATGRTDRCRPFGPSSTRPSFRARKVSVVSTEVALVILRLLRFVLGLVGQETTLIRRRIPSLTSGTHCSVDPFGAPHLRSYHFLRSSAQPLRSGEALSADLRVISPRIGAYPKESTSRGALLSRPSVVGHVGPTPSGRERSRPSGPGSAIPSGDRPQGHSRTIQAHSRPFFWGAASRCSQRGWPQHAVLAPQKQVLE